MVVATKRIAPSPIAVAGSSRTSNAGSGCFNFSRAPIWQDKKNTCARSQIKVFFRLTTRLSPHKKAARDFKNGVASHKKRHFPYTRAFYHDLTHGSWKIVLLEQVKGDHNKALQIERRMKQKHETYAGFSQLDAKK